MVYNNIFLYSLLEPHESKHLQVSRIRNRLFRTLDKAKEDRLSQRFSDS